MAGFSQTNPAMLRQGQNDQAPVLIETFPSRQGEYGSRCSNGLEQALDGWVENPELRGRQLETLAWRLKLLEEWIRQEVTGLVRRQERMSLVQAGALKEKLCSFGRTLSQKI